MDGGVANPFRLQTVYPTLATTNPALFADMNGITFFTDTNRSRAQLQKPFPHMPNLTYDNAPVGRVRTNGIEASFSRRWSKGWMMNVNFTGTKAQAADWFPNPWNTVPAWREHGYARPYRVTATGIYEFPFGRRKAFFKSGVMSKLLGGMQLGGTFETQAGAFMDWGNRYYYGDLDNIRKDEPTLNEWFNTKGTKCGESYGQDTGWERCSQNGPANYQSRIFPSRIPGLRRDKTLQTNANVQKTIPLRAERIRMILRFDMLNVFNRHQFNTPNIDPMSTDFGRVTSQTSAVNRWLQFQGRIQF
jgi:outer membrane receptor protein involved in Fe transport